MRKRIGGGSARWLALGLAGGVLLAPAAAVGAASLVGIVGSNGKRAQVTAANQLQTAPATPSQFRNRWTSISTTCTEVFAAPANKGAVVTLVLFNVFANPSPGSGQWAALFRDSACTPSPPNIITILNPGGIGPIETSFDPGFALRPGGKLYARTNGSVSAEATVRGYLVPKAAVPATTPAARPAGDAGAYAQQ